MRLRPRTTTHSTTLESTTRLLLSHSTVTQPQKLKTSILDASIEYENGAMKHARALALSLRSDAVPPVPVANASGRRMYAETGFGIEACSSPGLLASRSVCGRPWSEHAFWLG